MNSLSPFSIWIDPKKKKKKISKEEKLQQLIQEKDNVLRLKDNQINLLVKRLAEQQNQRVKAEEKVVQIETKLKQQLQITEEKVDTLEKTTEKREQEYQLAMNSRLELEEQLQMWKISCTELKAKVEVFQGKDNGEEMVNLMKIFEEAKNK